MYFDTLYSKFDRQNTKLENDFNLGISPLHSPGLSKNMQVSTQCIILSCYDKGQLKFYSDWGRNYVRPLSMQTCFIVQLYYQVVKRFERI